MKIRIDGEAYDYDSKFEKDLNKIIEERDHQYVADELIAEFHSLDFARICAVEELYPKIKKLDIRGMGPLSSMELAMKLVRFITYFEPKEEYN